MEPGNYNNFSYGFEDESQNPSLTSQFPQNSSQYSQYNPYAPGYPVSSFLSYIQSHPQAADSPTIPPRPAVVEVGQGSQPRRAKTPRNTLPARRPSWYPA